MFGNILIWFVVIPVIMMAGLGLCRNSSMNAIRSVMVVCSTILLGLSVWLCIDFLRLREMGVTDEMLYTGSWMWYAPLNIHLAVGVDGISVLMLMLSSVIVFAGTFASWKINPLPKNTAEILSRYKTIIVAELNTGQFADYLQMHMPGHEILRINKVEGQPFLVKEIVDGVIKHIEQK